MRFTTKKTLTIDLKLDGSEAVLFEKGGKHQVTLNDLGFENIADFNEMIISVQLDPSHKGYYDHVTADKPR